MYWLSLGAAHALGLNYLEAVRAAFYIRVF